MTVNEDFAFHIPPGLNDFETAPLFCAGAIGYRSLHLTNIKDGDSLGLVGFGASAYLVLKSAKYLFPKSEIMVFARNEEERNFALSIGASWAGELNYQCPHQLDAIIDTTPVWASLLRSLSHLKPGGRLVINAISKEASDKYNLLDIDYQKHLWLEREIKSVANISRKDVEDFLRLAEKISLQPEIEIYSFSEINKAICDLKHKRVRGAKVLAINK